MGVQGGLKHDNRPGWVIVVFGFLAIVLFVAFHGNDSVESPPVVHYRVEMIDKSRSWIAKGTVKTVDAGVVQTDTMGWFIDAATGEKVFIPLSQIVITEIKS